MILTWFTGLNKHCETSFSFSNVHIAEFWFYDWSIAKAILFIQIAFWDVRDTLEESERSRTDETRASDDNHDYSANLWSCHFWNEARKPAVWSQLALECELEIRKMGSRWAPAWKLESQCPKCIFCVNGSWRSSGFSGVYDNQFILRMEYLYGLDSVKIEFGWDAFLTALENSHTNLP